MNWLGVIGWTFLSVLPAVSLVGLERPYRVLVAGHSAAGPGAPLWSAACAAAIGLVLYAAARAGAELLGVFAYLARLRNPAKHYHPLQLEEKEAFAKDPLNRVAAVRAAASLAYDEESLPLWRRRSWRNREARVTEVLAIATSCVILLAAWRTGYEHPAIAAILGGGLLIAPWCSNFIRGVVFRMDA